MRTLSEIVEAAKDGRKPDHDECYWAMLALDALLHFDHQDVRRLGYPERQRTQAYAKMLADESFRRLKAALSKSPQEWVGPSNDPANPDYQRVRRAAFNVLEKVEQRRVEKEGGT